MEDALVPWVKNDDTATLERLNPCFNGRCTRTNRESITTKAPILS